VEPWLRVSAAGAALRGDLTVAGEVSVAAAVAFQSSGAGHTGQDWSFYRVQATGGPEELRVQLPPPGNDPAADPGGSLVIGSWSQERQAFVPALTVRADGLVTVDGTLRVERYEEVSGTTPANENRIAGGLDEEADRLVTGAMLSGITGAAGLANQLAATNAPSPPSAGFFASATPFAAAQADVVPGAAPDLGPAVTPGLAPGLAPGFASVLADVLAADAELQDRLVAELRSRHAATADALRGRLGPDGE
jgi:hypothetical protein